MPPPLAQSPAGLIAGNVMIELSPAPAKLPPGRRVYAIGDIHGCAAQLANLHAQIEEDLAQNGLPLAMGNGSKEVDRFVGGDGEPKTREFPAENVERLYLAAASDATASLSPRFMVAFSGISLARICASIGPRRLA